MITDETGVALAFFQGGVHVGGYFSRAAAAERRSAASE
jgi:hypothetical protein